MPALSEGQLWLTPCHTEGGDQAHQMTAGAKVLGGTQWYSSMSPETLPPYSLNRFLSTE